MDATHGSEQASEQAEAEHATAFARVEDALLRLQPEGSLFLFRPPFITGRVQQFVRGFPGEVGYAVRANAAPDILRRMKESGLTWYACDSLAEIAAVTACHPDANLLFAHPLKTRQDIKQAYGTHRVRTFVVDHPGELAKLGAEAGPDSTLLVKVGVSPGALVPEGPYYGCDIAQAVTLCREVVDAGYKLGLCFNLGSQVMNPALFDEALLILREVMYRARFMLDMVCVGGGFPTLYDGLTPPAPETFFAMIERGLSRLHLPRTCRVLATPGRVLVNEAVSIVLQVRRRRGPLLFINDGVEGNLRNLIHPWWRPPARLIRFEGPPPSRTLERYAFIGPGSTGEDVIPGPFYLPRNVRAGDYIELGNVGAYASGPSGSSPLVTVEEDPPTPATDAEIPEDFYEPVFTPSRYGHPLGEDTTAEASRPPDQSSSLPGLSPLLAGSLSSLVPGLSLKGPRRKKP